MKSTVITVSEKATELSFLKLADSKSFETIIEILQKHFNAEIRNRYEFTSKVCDLAINGISVHLNDWYGNTLYAYDSKEIELLKLIHEKWDLVC